MSQLSIKIPLQHAALVNSFRGRDDRRCTSHPTRSPLAVRCSATLSSVTKSVKSGDSKLSITSRRTVLGAAAAVLGFPLLPKPSQAADDLKTIMVVGATGASGKLVYKELMGREGVKVIAGVRNLDKAKKLGITDAVQIDVTSDPETIAASLVGVDAVVCATGFVPGNPLKMAKAAHAVDNVGTVNLVDAAVSSGVQKFVLISSILTNGRAIGQEKAPGFVITNAFGGVLDEKLVGEKHLKESGLTYTIVRPGGLKSEAPKAPLVVAPEDTLFSGEISRDLVAAAVVEAVFAEGANNKVVEIMESGSCIDPGKPGCPAAAGSNDRSTWFA
mmetsp:Transcript_21020/g.46092  ORF Transcript_21020/g.46092 Transcript_21020/m.46092 type:complete len:330 (-) Transcript_21020:267-1256(-)